MVLNKIIGIAVGLLVAAVIIPVGILAIADANVTGWNASVVTVFQVLLPILAVIALALYFMPKMGGND